MFIPNRDLHCKIKSYSKQMNTTARVKIYLHNLLRFLLNKKKIDQSCIHAVIYDIRKGRNYTACVYLSTHKFVSNKSVINRKSVNKVCKQ